MKIITISREFGSGGRELGKRLADHLGFDYYDRELISAIAENKGVNENYVDYLLNRQSMADIPLVFRQSFHAPSVLQAAQIEMLLEQKRVIESIAELDRDCIIVGRNADILLAEHQPYNIFVCADTKSKVERCLKRAKPEEELTERKIIQNMKLIDKNRKRTRAAICDTEWGSRESYHIIVNTSGWEIKELVPPVAVLAESWFSKIRK